MISLIYQDWLHQWDAERDRKKCNTLLLQDNFSSHIIPNDLKWIEVVNFEPNLTAHVQPKDQGIIQCFKAHYPTWYIHMQLIDMIQALLQAIFMTSINSRPCELLMMCGMSWIQQLFDIAGARLRFYLKMQQHWPSPPCQSLHFSILSIMTLTMKFKIIPSSMLSARWRVQLRS